jgi:peptidoglycan hydrolase-like protein with peptidoglycan-binding domain
MLKKVVLGAVVGTLITAGVGFGLPAANASEGSAVRAKDVLACKESYVHRGSSGHCVWILQVALRKAYYGPISTDGSFGPQTGARVNQYNASHGFPSDQKAYPGTFVALARNFS